MKPTLLDYSLDGRKTLDQILRSSCYGSLLQTVASLTVFSHPQTVAQTENQNVFRMVRNMKLRSQTDDTEKVVYDDNAGPHMAFVAANRLKSITGKRDLQLNHIWPGLAQDVTSSLIHFSLFRLFNRTFRSSPYLLRIHLLNLR